MIQFNICILYFIVITVETIFIALERLLTYKKNQPIVRKEFWNDFIIYNFNQFAFDFRKFNLKPKGIF